MAVTEETYKRVTLEDTDDQWELVCGRLRKKPPMTTEHYLTARLLQASLIRQLDTREYLVTESAKLRTPDGHCYIPDVCVVPMASIRRLMEVPRTFEMHVDPMPLVVEVWSPSTGEYDDDEKLPTYQTRGDLEIWRLHPYERTLIAWRRQPNGAYAEMLHEGGMVQPMALPGVVIVLDELFG